MGHPVRDADLRPAKTERGGGARVAAHDLSAPVAWPDSICPDRAALFAPAADGAAVETLENDPRRAGDPGPRAKGGGGPRSPAGVCPCGEVGAEPGRFSNLRR